MSLKPNITDLCVETTSRKVTMPSEWMEDVPWSTSPPHDHQKSPHTIFHGGVDRPHIPGLNPSSEYDPSETISQSPVRPATSEALLMQGERSHQDAKSQAVMFPSKPPHTKSIKAIMATNDNDSLFGDSDPESDIIPSARRENTELLMSGALQSSLPAFVPGAFHRTSHQNGIPSSDDYQSRCEESDEEVELEEEEEYEPPDPTQELLEYTIDTEIAHGREYDPSRPWILGYHAQKDATLRIPAERLKESDKIGDPPSPSESELVSRGFEFHQEIPEDIQIAQFGHSAYRDALRKVQPDIPRKQQWYLFREVERALKDINPRIAQTPVPKSMLGVCVCGCNGYTEKCACSPWFCACGECDHSDEVDRFMRKYWQKGCEIDGLNLNDEVGASPVCSCLPGLCHCEKGSLVTPSPSPGTRWCWARDNLTKGPPHWQDVFPKGELVVSPDYRWGIKSALPPLPWKMVQRFWKESAVKKDQMSDEQRKDAILEFYAWEQKNEAEASKGTTPKVKRGQNHHEQYLSLASSSASDPKFRCLANGCVFEQGQQHLGAADLATVSDDQVLVSMSLERGSSMPISRPDTPRPPLDAKTTTPYASDVNHDSIRQSVEPEFPSAEWHRESTPAYEDRSQSPSPVSMNGILQIRDPCLADYPVSTKTPVPLPIAESSSAVNEKASSRQSYDVITNWLSYPMKIPKRNDRIKNGVQGAKIEKRSATSSASKGRNMNRRATTMRPPPAALEKADRVKTQLEKDIELQEAPKPGMERVSSMVADIEARERQKSTGDGLRQRDGTPVRRSSRANKGIRSSPGYAEEFS
ncbi:hypothetical protein B0A52_10278 [Exophiala mesophila]|uniref:Uncharacterized protein n=1 Tax=Exophiala mesophila TaxID=212818 RepID=A0A438MQH0_EXOME|nr:hypothetical protein B0A52_10278 [Exophiala mesophila]